MRLYYNKFEFKEKGVGKMKILNFKQANKYIVDKEWGRKIFVFPTI